MNCISIVRDALTTADRQFIARVVADIGLQLRADWAQSGGTWNNTRHDENGTTNAQWNAHVAGIELESLPEEVLSEADVIAHYISGLESARSGLNSERSEWFGELGLCESNDGIARCISAIDDIDNLKFPRVVSLLAVANKRLTELERRYH